RRGFILAASGRRDEVPERLKVRPIEDMLRWLADNLPVQAEQPRSGAVDRRHCARRIDGHDAGRYPLQNRLDITAPTFDFDVFALEGERAALHPPPAARQFAGHRVERLDERAEFVVRLSLDALVETSCTNFPGSGGERLHRTSDPLGEIEPHPG